MGRSYKSKVRQTKRSSAKAGKGPEAQEEKAALIPIAVMVVVLLMVGGAAYMYLSSQGSDGDEGLGDDDNGQDDTGTAQGTGPLFIPIENIQGGTFKLNDLKGRVVVLDLFATWCGPCKLQMEELRDLRQNFPTSQVEIISIGVDLSESISLLQDFKTDENAEWPFAASNQAFNAAFPASSIPTLYILDQSGKAVKTHVGVTQSEVLITEISALFV